MLDSTSLLSPATARAAKDVVAINAYLLGSSNSLCVTDATGQIVANPAGEAWLAEMRAAHLRPVFTWELSPTAPEGGEAAGIWDAVHILECNHALGHAVDEVFVANDSVVTDMAAVLAYFRTVASRLQGVIVPSLYGQALLYDAVRGPIKHLWKAPDGTNVRPPGTLFVQRYPPTSIGGVSVDLNDVTPAGLAWARETITKKEPPMILFLCTDNPPATDRAQLTDGFHRRGLSPAETKGWNEVLSPLGAVREGPYWSLVSALPTEP